MRREISKFKLCDKLRDMSACAHNIDRTFLRNTFKIIQLSVLHHIFTKTSSFFLKNQKYIKNVIRIKD